MASDWTVEQREGMRALTQAHSSPEKNFPIQEPRKPGLITNVLGTPWSGMIKGSDIIGQGGTTYGDTTIKLGNPDTRNRVEAAKRPLRDHDFYKADPKQQAALLNKFAANLHQNDVVGSYFPTVLLLQAQQQAIINAGKERILNADQSSAIADLRREQVARNTALWARKDKKGVVEDASVVAIEENNVTTQLAILQIEIEAATEVLGADKAAKLQAAVMRDVDGLSELDVQQRIAAELTEEAAKTKLTAEETAKLEELKKAEDTAWGEKHEKQKDFVDAIKDGNPDCSEYASMTAVALAEMGIKTMRVMGHTMSDTDYPSIGAHAYNLVLSEDGQTILGVLEGTAKSGAFREVMNGVTLAEFQAGKTLVTFNEEAGWSTYGTGAPAKGRNLDEFVYDPKTDTGHFVRDEIEAADVSAIAKAKMDYVNSMSPEAVADQLIGIYHQYDDSVKIQAWIDDIRDGMIPGDNTNPALAQAAQILHDYRGLMPPPPEMRDRIIEIVRDAQSRAKTDNNYDLAITPEALQMLEEPAASKLASDIKEALDKLSPDQIQSLSQTMPWLAEAVQINKRIGNVPYGYSRTEKSAFDHAHEGNETFLDAYSEIASLVKNNDISSEDLSALRTAGFDKALTPSIALPAAAQP